MTLIVDSPHLPARLHGRPLPLPCERCGRIRQDYVNDVALCPEPTPLGLLCPSCNPAESYQPTAEPLTVHPRGPRPYRRRKVAK